MSVRGHILNAQDSRPIWGAIFDAGLAGLLLALCTSFLASLANIVRVDFLQVLRGNMLIEFAMNAGAFIWVGCSLALLAPNLRHLFRVHESHGVNRVAWLLFLVLFPYVSNYFYYWNMIRKKATLGLNGTSRDRL